VSEGKYGGTECPKDLEENRSCRKECGLCRLVGDWSNWGECVKGEKCEDNYQVRVREQVDCPEKYLNQRRQCFLDNCF